jgi:hypothetical protein
MCSYEVGCIPCMLYVASGGSLDWALGEAGIPYSYGKFYTCFYSCIVISITQPWISMVVCIDYPR